jgi:hypothetical protein
MSDSFRVLFEQPNRVSADGESLLRICAPRVAVSDLTPKLVRLGVRVCGSIKIAGAMYYIETAKIDCF